MAYRIFLTVLILTLFLSLAEAQLLLRFPDLDPGGERVAFSYQGDIWTAKIDGSEVRRWTVHEGYDSHPRWSKDGQQIAFQSNRYGNDDIFVIDLESGMVMQKTHFSSRDRMPAWKPEGTLTFMTGRAYQQLEREQEVYGFDGEVGTPSRQLSALAMGVEPSYTEGLWAIVKGYCRPSREAYRGPAQRDIYLAWPGEDRYRQLTTDEGQDVQVRWSEEALFVLSARSGKYNIYKTDDPQAEDIQWEAVTEYEDWGLRHFSVSGDGQTMAFEREDGIYIKEGTADAQRLMVALPADFKFYPSERKSYSSNLRDYALSPNEKYAALETRGELFLTAVDPKKSKTVRLTESAHRDRSAAWLNDSTLLFVSDRDGREKIYRMQSEDAEIGDLFWTFERKTDLLIEREGMIDDFALSPDRDRIAITFYPGVLQIADIDSTGEIGDFETYYEGWAMPSNLAWSPDGRWLAYDQPNLNFNREVFLLPVAEEPGAEAVNVSMHPRRDYAPKWSPDGEKLAFISTRNNGDADIWFVWLREADALRATADREEMEDWPAALKKRLGMEPDSADRDSLRIDTDQLFRRVKQVTSYSGSESQVAIDKKGETLYFIANDGEDRRLMKVKWDGSEAKKIMDASGLRGLTTAPDGGELFFIRRGKLQRLKNGKKKPENLPFRAKMEIDYQAEQAQMFDEAWRQLNARFYDPNFHGRDFDALREAYRPIALRASTRQDFRDIFNEMLGQINASHMGMYGGSREDVQRVRSGRIGAELTPVAAGWRVDRIIPKGPADRPDVDLAVGDVIIAIDGTALTEVANYYALLEDKNNERLWMKVEAAEGGEKDVYLRAKASVRSELYDAWVAERRQLTERYSGGRLGYIHIQGMNWSSFEDFERELMAVGYGKDGIVIDVRFNGGGWTTDMLLTVLNVRQHAYTIPRNATDDLSNHEKFADYYPYGERLPLSAWTRPSVALCNEFSYSNAEIFSHAFKNLGIGPLVGHPTFGAVISTGGARLIDGSLIRLPFRGWFIKASGKNMDFQPAVPDHIVEQPVGVKAMDEDPQLKKAVEVLLAGMEEE